MEPSRHSIAGTLPPLLLIFLIYSPMAFAEAPQLNPPDGASIDTAKPTIMASLPKPIDTSTLFVMVDDTDVTAELVTEQTAFSYTVALPLSPGSHDVVAQGLYADGNEFTLWWSFTTTTAGSPGPDELQAGTELSGNAFWLGNDNDLNGALPKHAVQVVGPTHLRIAEGATSFEVQGNFLYLDQDGDLPEGDIKEGSDFRDFLILTRFAGEHATSEIGVGDITIQETPLTAPGMTRRGAYIQQSRANTTLRIFSVNATPVFGVQDGMALESEKDTTLSGASLDVVSDDALSRFHLTVLSGSDLPGSGFSQGGFNTRSEGRTIGALWGWGLPSGELRGGIEVAAAEFIADADSPGNTEVEDVAYAVNATWAPSHYFEQTLRVESLGADYVSIGNPGVVNDLRRFNLENGFISNRNRFDLTFGYAFDNLDGRNDIPTTSLRKFGGKNSSFVNEHLTLLLDATREIIDSADEPINQLPTKIVIDRAGISASWVDEVWSLSPQFTYAVRDDRTSFNADSTLSESRFDVSYRPTAELSISLTLPQFILEDDKLNNVEQKTRLVSLLINSWMLDSLVQFDLSGNWQKIDSSDNTLRETRYDGSARAALSLKKYLPDYFQPSLYMQGQYTRVMDDVLSTKVDEFTLYFGIEVFSGLSI